MTDSAIATREDSQAIREMLRTLKVRVDMGANEGTSNFVMDLMSQILSAGSEQEVFELQESGMKSGKDFAGRPFILKGEDIDWRQASAEYVSQGAFPFYAIMRVTEIQTGEEHVLNCGGNTFVASLFALEKLGYFDPEAYPEGRGLLIVSTPSPAGAYLTVRPVRQPEPAKTPAASGRARK